jgi:phosphatidyl-myo-inositol dimannoside synthase
MSVGAPLGLSAGGGIAHVPATRTRSAFTPVFAGYRSAAKNVRRPTTRSGAVDMNVLALVSDAFGGSGGIAQYNRDLIRALALAGTRPGIVVVPRRGRVAPADLPAGVRQLAPRAGKLRYALSTCRAAVAEGPFDAVFCGHLHMAPLGVVVARLLGVPLWLQLHGWEAWQRLAKLQHWAAAHADLVTAVSRHTRRRFLQVCGVAPWRIRVLPNTVNGRFRPGGKPDRLLDRYRLRGRKVLLTVGRLAASEGRKGHDTIIRALPGMLRARLELVYLIVGEGDDRPRLETLARQLGVADKVVFAGMVAPGELADYYRLADVFVMPSTQEGFGIVFLEAAACGLKPVGGNLDGSIDALADGAIGIAVDPADSQALVRAIEEVVAGGGPDPAEVRRFGFENFSRHVGELTSLLRATAAA